MQIRRRGGTGAILNSKSEFDWCGIPRLVVKEQDLEKDSELQLQREQEIAEHLDKEQRDWESNKTRERANEHLAMMSRPGHKSLKRTNNDGATRLEDKKRRKYELVSEDWGEQDELETNLDVIKEQGTPHKTEDQVHEEKEGAQSIVPRELAPKNSKEQTPPKADTTIHTLK